MHRGDDHRRDAQQTEREGQGDPDRGERADERLTAVQAEEPIRDDDGADHDGQGREQRACPVAARGGEFGRAAVDLGPEVAQLRARQRCEPGTMAVGARALRRAYAKVHEDPRDEQGGAGDRGNDGDGV